MPTEFKFREVFNPAVVTKLAEDIHRIWPVFDRAGFTTAINPKLERLSFGDRSGLIRDTLPQFLPPDFPRAVQILIDSLGPELTEPELTGYDGFIIMPQTNFVATYGLDHFELSMAALYEMTKRFTAEGAIRPFIERYPEQTLQRLAEWSHDENCHVRRLVSEGTRPRLPLASHLTRFIEDPRPVLKLLDNLKQDPVLLVRRSVANNLNDIAKDNPALVVKTLQAWHPIDDPGTQWLIRHAARTLLKQGHPDVLRLLGYPPQPAIAVQNLVLAQKSIEMGESLDFSFNIQSEADRSQKLMIDYIIHHVKANGRRSPKVFKLAKKSLKANERLVLRKSHPFKPLSTRTYYSGQHLLQLQINGQIQAEAAFELIVAQQF